MAIKKDNRPKSNFSKITIGLASPDTILERSYGEVLKPETINYRTYKPERDGLFCERIFGPVKDYECACGKYKRIRYKGIVCDRCGVEVTEKKVRRERMGHIKLVVPIVHIWYFKSLPNKIGYLLGMSSKKLETIIYYERYAIIQPGVLEDKFQTGDLLSEEEYLDVIDTLPKDNQYLPDDDPQKFIAKMGAEAVSDLLAKSDLDALSYTLRNAAANETSQQRRADALKRLSVVESFRDAQTRITNRPEWMVMQYIPVIPPELRPLVPLDGGRFASSDLNDLYRRVIIRNNRLKRLMEIKAPEVILRNEKRMLQESVDSLFDNSRKSNAVKAEGGRALKSLSDVLKGKQGRFRQNLLGKRVDYSGRSVIVVGPELKMHECGLPKDMAAELFKPFIIRKLIERGIVKTVKSAKKLVDKKEAIVWDILENTLKGHPILLNRAPTLHRLSIQAFQPKMIEGKAIQLHPLVTAGFNADFDGDQMAVHVPLSNAAILEAQLLLLASHNILNPQNGTPVTLPSQDMVLGLYYITKGKKSTETEIVRGEGKVFYNQQEVTIAYNEGKIDLHANIKVKTNVREKNGTLVNKLVETTVGRVLFNEFVPEEVGFINALLTKKSLRDIIGEIINITNVATAAKFLDDIKQLGFRMAFRGGLSFSINDLIIPDTRNELLERAKEEVEEVWENYNMGLITNNERYNQVVDIWSRVDTRLTETLIREMQTDKQGFNAVYMMLDSGARGSKQQVKQLAGIRGLMAKPRKSGSTGSEIVENPILSNFKGGLNVLDYFISTHGARKGLADTALKTADAGYLTRRLVDVAQDVVISEEDCGTLRGITTTALKDNEDIIAPLSERIEGRTSLHDVLNPISGDLIIEAGQEITHDKAIEIDEAGVDSIEIRSVLTCEAKRGVCVKCYGKNLATGYLAQRGDSVGIIAAQSIGEPGTQLTLRTFHVGGIAGSSSIESSMIAKFDGTVQFDGLRTVKTENAEGETVEIVIGRTGEIRIADLENDRLLNTSNIPYGATLNVKNGQKIRKGDVVCTWDPFNNVVISEIAGEVKFDNIIEGITFREESDEQTGHRDKVIVESKDKTKIPSLIVDGKEEKSYNLPVGSRLVVGEGDHVKAGQVIVKIPRTMRKSGDITGGLPRVTELFEARNPSNPAVVAEIDGVVTFGNIKRGNREIVVEAKDGIVKKYLVPLTRQILVQDGDFVKAGTPLSDGQTAPLDILAIKGPFAVQEYVVNEIQEVYRLQGVKINDKHIEVIVRQMMKKVVIIDAGDTKFLEEDLEDRNDFNEENDRIFDKKVVEEAGDSTRLKPGQIVSVRELREENSLLRREDKNLVTVRDARPATAQPVLLGITKASLGVPSWISAASFQETTKVLSSAAIQGKTDLMSGLKENVITGHQIPAGTGLREFDKLIVGNKEEYELLTTTREAMSFDEEE
ncbi:DNA-directed RNA polymerase subunit beta' [Haoranjiania flava]|uniref:DNA-directed RNA polymerase subunit beta' n=1 Tax=Haoranjiania flava TaxID=1856322 RepID=A0AAE3LMT9_9BACT|nr:DNA-directed RNA polymerase subunit beta' [Haoranjiania flava]MCU7694256.1 DNA-directed RNA polymerase subunit beta' [Haoranjiania flava]